MKIIINYDFTNGEELSYGELIEKKSGVHYTNCLYFFNNDEDVEDVMVVDKNHNVLSRKLLMSNRSNYTNKDMREAHNLHKMLVAGSFKWQIK